jgi:asparagine synthase (glutamine-hydrolysing)
MHQTHPLREVIDLTDPTRNVLFNATLEEAREAIAEGDPDRVRAIDGHFALVARQGEIVRMARSLSVPMRYFIVKRMDGPALVVAHRIDAIERWLREEGLSEQFHPTYTRMVPAHYITEIALVGCPDPNPKYVRYFAPRRETLPPDPTRIGAKYVGAAADAVGKWLRQVPEREPVGVCFSGGIDSGAVFLLTYHAMLRSGLNPSRLKAFTLCVDGEGSDLDQSRRFLEAVGLQLFHEPIDVPAEWIDSQEAVRVIEDYKPLDVQAGAMLLALCRGIRERYPQWRYLIDGDGGDENLKDYPIEENPELTIRSVLNNRMLYQEGWGVDSIKHSLVYSGGLSRACTRTFAPTAKLGFDAFSPFTLPSVIEVAEGIPFISLTQWRHDRLYQLKGEVVASGVKAVTGYDMPVYEKRRFQHGGADRSTLSKRMPDSEDGYRRAFQEAFDG